MAGERSSPARAASSPQPPAPPPGGCKPSASSIRTSPDVVATASRLPYACTAVALSWCVCPLCLLEPPARDTE